MTDNKTKKTNKSVDDFIEALKDEAQRDDSRALVKLMKSVSKQEPKMWGSSLIGFGDYHYKYATGREGDIFQIGFSPRKQALVLYFMDGLQRHLEALKKLGKHKTGKGCLYIKKLD